MAHAVLHEDWSDYDNKKKRWEDRLFFSCEESWEVDYLVNKLRKHFPYKTDTAIRQAITACCQTIRAPRPRHTFVDCVISRLS